MQAQRAVTNSDEFNIICRDVVRHVDERNLADSFTELSDAEQQNLLDDVFAQLGASANQYEQCVESRVDACLSEAVMAARNVSTEESVVETVEKFASCGILSLLSSIPYENFLGAAQALVGRSVPSQLRAPLWTRRLGHLSAEESFHREQNADRLGTISVDDAAILAECKAILGKTTVGSLKPGDLEAMKISLSCVPLKYRMYF